MILSQGAKQSLLNIPGLSRRLPLMPLVPPAQRLLQLLQGPIHLPPSLPENISRAGTVPFSDSYYAIIFFKARKGGTENGHWLDPNDMCFTMYVSWLVEQLCEGWGCIVLVLLHKGEWRSAEMKLCLRCAWVTSGSTKCGTQVCLAWHSSPFSPARNFHVRAVAVRAWGIPDELIPFVVLLWGHRCQLLFTCWSVRHREAPSWACSQSGMGWPAPQVLALGWGDYVFFSPWEMVNLRTRCTWVWNPFLLLSIAWSRTGTQPRWASIPRLGRG